MVKQRSNEEFKRGPRRCFFPKLDMSKNFGSGQQRKGFEPLVPKFGVFCRGIIINTMVLIHVGWTMVKQRSNEEFKRGPRRRFFFPKLDISKLWKWAAAKRFRTACSKV